MSILKKENWIINLILLIISFGGMSLCYAILLNLIDKNAWYCNYKYWLYGLVCLVFPVFIMVVVFLIQMLCKVASELKVPGNEIYNTPYSWIICIVCPIIGWCMLFVMYIYLCVWIAIMLKNGNGEKYIKE